MTLNASWRTAIALPWDKECISWMGRKDKRLVVVNSIRSRYLPSSMPELMNPVEVSTRTHTHTHTHTHCTHTRASPTDHWSFLLARTRLSLIFWSVPPFLPSFFFFFKWQILAQAFSSPYKPRAELMVQMLSSVLCRPTTKKHGGDDQFDFASGLRWYKSEGK